MCPAALYIASTSSASSNSNSNSNDKNKNVQKIMGRADADATSPSSSSSSSSSLPSPPASLDLETCTPQVLVDRLRYGRFAGNAQDTLAFFKKAMEVATADDVDDVDVADVTDVAANGTTTSRTADASVSDQEERGTPLLAAPMETSLLTPRAGKVSLQLYDAGGLVATHLKDPETKLHIPPSAVSHLILFAKPEDYKTMSGQAGSKKVPNAHLVLLTLRPDSNIFFPSKAKAPLSQVCFALSWVKGTGPTGPALVEGGFSSEPEQQDSWGWNAATAAWRTVLERSFRTANNDLVVGQVQPQVHKDDDSGDDSGGGGDDSLSLPFLSHQIPGTSTTTGNMPFVQCYHGVQDGVLYPLQEGLLFYKPPRFLPRSKLHSIACGRGSGGGPSSSRYVDMVVETTGTVENEDEIGLVEFTNIQREELGVLNKYLYHVLIPAMQADQTKAKTVGGTEDDTDQGIRSSDHGHDDEEDETEDEEEDSDVDDGNFVDADEDEDEEDGNNSDSDEDDEEDQIEGDEDVEVVDDDFAKELAKQSNYVAVDEPRARRSAAKRKGGAPVVTAKPKIDEEVQADRNDDDDESIMGDEDDFQVVQTASSTESEDEDDVPVASPSKKSRL